MPVRESYAEGAPSWVDLTTADVEGSKAFYSALLGWEWEKIDIETAGGDYYLARLNGHTAAGLHRKPEDEVDTPWWTVYMSVDDLDATLSKVEPSGGSIIVPAIDVLDDGRMAIVADPTGGEIGLWEAGKRFGAEIMDDPGAFCWADLVTSDQKAAVDFFGKVVGLAHMWFDNPQLGEIAFLKVGDDGVAATMPPPEEGIPAHWDIYFTVVDCDESVAKITELGGSILDGPRDTGHGRLAAAADPAGAVFSIIALT